MKERTAVDNRFKAIALGSVAALLLAAMLVASSGANAAPTQRAGMGVAVNVAKTKLGQIIVDARGHTVYLFEKDAKGRSACYGKCTTFWPPLLSTVKPTAGPGVKATLLGLVARKDGTHQVTYAGHPLYGFVNDKAAGQTTGEGIKAFGGGWDVLSPAGAKIEGAKSTSGSTSGGYGKGYGG